MKRLLVYMLALFPVLTFAQGQKGEIKECAPMKNGKVCYRDTVHVRDMDKKQIYETLHKWLDKLHKARNKKYGDEIKKSELDHIMWYCYKSFKLH